jgi:hypothetical protein
MHHHARAGSRPLQRGRVAASACTHSMPATRYGRVPPARRCASTRQPAAANACATAPPNRPRAPRTRTVFVMIALLEVNRLSAMGALWKA